MLLCAVLLCDGLDGLWSLGGTVYGGKADCSVGGCARGHSSAVAWACACVRVCVCACACVRACVCAAEAVRECFAIIAVALFKSLRLWRTQAT